MSKRKKVKWEIDRILELPTWTPTEQEVQDLADKWTDKLKINPNHPARFHGAQAKALETISSLHSCFAPITVGGGKALLALCAHRAADLSADKVLILAPAKLCDELYVEYEKWRKVFDLDPPLIRSYEKLSSQKARDLLDELNPDLIVCDESHALKSKDANRTRRFLRYLDGRVKEGRPVGLVVMTGTPTSTGIRDYAHLCKASLGSMSPVPASWTRTEAWSRVLDANHQSPPRPEDWVDFTRLKDWAIDEDLLSTAQLKRLPAQKMARLAFAARLTSAVGVVSTTGSSCDKQLTLYENRAPFEPSERVLAALKQAERAWLLPNGDEIDDPLRMAAYLRQLTHGFYYVWDWEALGFAPGERDKEWLYARSGFSRLLRKARGRLGIDSYATLKSLILDDEGAEQVLSTDEEWIARDEWIEVMDRPEPPQKTIWFDDALFDYLNTLDKSTPMILWYNYRAIGERLADEGFKVKQGGELVPESDRTGDYLLALSIASHGTGLNLQAWNRAVTICPPSDGALWEQLLGRLHRGGQARDVEWEVWTHYSPLRGAWKKALDKARYIQDTQDSPQKLITSKHERR